MRILGSWVFETLCAGLMTATAALFGRSRTEMVQTEDLISSLDWSPQTFESDTIKFHSSVSSLTGLYNATSLLAVCTAVAMAAKIIFAFSFGRRLGLFHRAFSRAAPDLIAAGLLVGLVFTIYGFVGQCVYGTAISVWAEPYSAGLALFRELNGEGPTEQMIAASPMVTPILYGSFYIIVQSTLLVVLFAIVSDNYGEVREEQRDEIRQAALLVDENDDESSLKLKRLKQGAFQDLAEGFTGIPGFIFVLRRKACGSRRNNRPGFLGPMFLVCGVGIPEAKRATALRRRNLDVISTAPEARGPTVAMSPSSANAKMPVFLEIASPSPSSQRESYATDHVDGSSPSSAAVPSVQGDTASSPVPSPDATVIHTR